MVSEVFRGFSRFVVFPVFVFGFSTPFSEVFRGFPSPLSEGFRALSETLSEASPRLSQRPSRGPHLRAVASCVRSLCVLSDRFVRPLVKVFMQLGQVQFFHFLWFCVIEGL